MPLVALALSAYAAGLLAGFASLLPWASGIGAATLCAAALRRDARLAALALLLAAGAVAAAARMRVDERCLASAVRAPALAAVLVDDAAPGAYVRARWASARCAGSLGAAVARGTARAGDRVAIAGSASPARQGGLVVREATIAAEPGGGDALVRLRSRATAVVDRLFGVDAPVARALLVADARSLDPAVRDRFADAGLVHILSISGLHVAIIAAAVELLLRAMRVPRGAALGASAAAGMLYVAIIGAPPSAVRAGTMLGVAALCRARGRATSPWAALALGAWAPLALDERAAADIGWQLSVAGMAAVIAAGALARRSPLARLAGWRRELALALLVSVLASAVTAPLVAWQFGRISIVAPLANLAAAPLVAVLQPALFLALALAPVDGAAAFVADATRPLLRGLDAIASAAAALPFAAVGVAPTLAAALLAGAAMTALLAACAARQRARPLVLCGASVAAAIWLPLLPASRGRAELHMIDVGQGDAVAVRSPRGRWILFDAGRSWRGGDEGRRSVVPYLRRHGGALAAFVLSHPHADHAGGAPSVLTALRPDAFWDGAYVGESPSYAAALEAAARTRTRWRRARPGDSLAVDGVVVTFLAPDSVWMRGLDDPNEASVVAVVRFGSVRFLLVGDAERAEEGWLLDNARDALRADVLKVGHHGSRTSSTPEFVAAVRPRLALVSVGAGNGYGHPSASVLGELVSAGATVLRSDRMGSIVVRTDGRDITVEMEGDEWGLPPRSREP